MVSWTADKSLKTVSTLTLLAMSLYTSWFLPFWLMSSVVGLSRLFFERLEEVGLVLSLFSIMDEASFWYFPFSWRVLNCFLCERRFSYSESLASVELILAIILVIVHVQQVGVVRYGYGVSVPIVLSNHCIAPGVCVLGHSVSLFSVIYRVDVCSMVKVTRSILRFTLTQLIKTAFNVCWTCTHF